MSFDRVLSKDASLGTPGREFGLVIVSIDDNSHCHDIWDFASIP